MTDDSSKAVRWLPTSSGRITGWLGLVIAVVLAVLAVVGSLPWWGLGAAAVLAWLGWAAMLRPRIGLTTDHLVLRGILSTTTVPLGRIRTVTVQQVLAVWVEERRYVSAAVGRSRRQSLRQTTAPHDATRTPRGTMHEADAIEDALRAAMRDSVGSGTPVTRAWAWPEIALGAAALLLLVVSLIV